MAAPQDPPARAPRLRAAERRGQLAHVAARRFHELGYHGVALGDVAAEAGVTGPAVYRHFPSKEALLAAALDGGLDLVDDALARTLDGPLDGAVAAVAEVGFLRPDLWLLLQRESRFLGPERRAAVQGRYHAVVVTLARRLRRERPELAADDAELLVSAAAAVLSLPSTTRSSLAAHDYHRELTASALACVRTDLDDERAVAAPAEAYVAVEVASHRREQVVDTAVELFSRRGYSGVSLDDIGAAVGIAGPSILHHFPTKADVLVTAFDRASTRLAQAQARRRASGRAADAAECVASYIAFCLANRSLLGVYVSELLHLPADARERTRTTVRTELGDWTRALLAGDLDLDEPTARVRVRAALAAINALVCSGDHTERPRIETEINVIALAVLRGRPPRR